MKPLAKVLENVLDPLAQRQGFISSKILLDWKNIVTPDFAKFAIPEKIIFSSQKAQGGILVVNTTSAMSATLPFESQEIIRRINRYFGYQAITRIKYNTTLVPQPLKPSFNTFLLTEEERASVAQDVQALQTPSLREALQSLGEAIKAQEKNLVKGHS